MKEIFKACFSWLLPIFSIYIFIWALNGWVTSNDFYLDVNFDGSENLVSSTVNGCTKWKYSFEAVLEHDNCHKILYNISNFDDVKLNKGRRVLHLKRYTTGSSWTDFVPFYPYNSNYFIVNNKQFLGEAKIAEYSKLFLPFSFSMRNWGYLLVLLYMVFLVLYMALTEWLIRDNRLLTYKSIAIIAKFCGILILLPIYFSNELYISVKIFLSSSFYHIFLITLFSLIIHQLINFKQPIKKFSITRN